MYRYTGGDWIALVRGGGSWEVRVKGNLTVRPDTGRINTSPITAISPILRLQHGCNHTIDIPSMHAIALKAWLCYLITDLYTIPSVDDVDGDEVRCRWARSSDGECAGVCDAFPDAILDQVL